MSTPEGKIQSSVLKYLHEQGVFCWRQNNLAIFDPKMNGYREHNGLKGVPDILAVINGRFVGFEIKTPRGRQSADQLFFQKRLERHKGKYFIIRSLDEAKEALATIL
jgi:hypothetical protein